jgi:hypothetical protein
MSKALGPSLDQLVQNFFWQRLQAQQQVSPHTVASYRDTLRLLLAFVQQQTGRAPSQQTLSDWNAPMILRFLDYVEKERGCQARTRNTRLAALRAFMRYVAQHAPEALALARRPPTTSSSSIRTTRWRGSRTFRDPRRNTSLSSTPRRLRRPARDVAGREVSEGLVVPAVRVLRQQMPRARRRRIFPW